MFLLLSNPLKVLQLISQVLEVRCPIVVLGREVLPLQIPVIVKLLRLGKLPGRLLILDSQVVQLHVLLFIQSLDRVVGSLLILCHVVVPCPSELIKLEPLHGLNMDQLLLLLLFHLAQLSLQFVVSQFFQLVLGPLGFNIVQFAATLSQVLLE